MPTKKQYRRARRFSKSGVTGMTGATGATGAAGLGNGGSGARIAPRNGSRLGTRARPEQTRQEILNAALREFAREGLAGARTDAIARAAGVNKALISYYFGGKNGLYSAALDHVFSQLVQVLNEVLDQDLRPGEKILAYAAAHFDFMARAPMLPRLVHREMMQAGRLGSEHVDRIATEYLQPLSRRLAAVIMEGIEAGEFRRVDPGQFLISMVGTIVHYFASANILRAITQMDPYSPERLAARRAAVLEFIAAGLFVPARPYSAVESGQRASEGRNSERMEVAAQRLLDSLKRSLTPEEYSAISGRRPQQPASPTGAASRPSDRPNESARGPESPAVWSEATGTKKEGNE